MFLYSLGTVCISGFVDAHEKERRAPLEMIMCQDCSLVQLRHTAPQELLYSGHYWYKSGVTDTMKAALRDITAQIERIVPLKKGDVVLDIGSNDGTMLRTYTIPGLIKVGVEPATNFAKEGREGVDVFINDFWHIQSYSDQVSQKAKVITAIGMFYDMDDPNEFIRDVAAALDPDGMFIAQLMCLKNMLDTNDLGNICHEHLEYYSLKTLQYLYQKNNLEIIDIQYNTVNGGSYRIFARLQGSNVPKQPSAKSRMRRFFAAEKGFDTKKVHTDFFARIEANKQKTVDFIKGEVAKGKTVWAYGASTKGNTILQFFGLDHTLIAGAADRSPDKWGKMTVGTHIPIYSEDDARKAKPDYFLVLPYSFIKEFYAREKDWLAGGGKFIVPLPEFRVIS
jgi:hypothetical protein